MRNNEDYVIRNHNLINVIITNDNDTTPSESLAHDILSFSYQTRVPIKIPHFGQWVTSGTKEQHREHRFHMPTGSSQTYLRNNMEQEIQTFYDNFLLGLCIYYTNCTLKRWYPVLSQSKITLNMLCLSCPHQQLFDQLHTAQYFDCKTNPIG